MVQVFPVDLSISPSDHFQIHVFAIEGNGFGEDLPAAVRKRKEAIKAGASINFSAKEPDLPMIGRSSVMTTEVSFDIYYWTNKLPIYRKTGE
jgi:hypothetical protein